MEFRESLLEKKRNALSVSLMMEKELNLALSSGIKRKTSDRRGLWKS